MLKAREHAKFLKWKKNKEKELMLLKSKVRRTTRRLAYLSHEHALRLSAAKHRLAEGQKALQKLRARKIDEEKRRTHHLISIIHHKKEHLHNLKVKYGQIMREVDVYKAKRHKLKLRAHARRLNFERKFRALKLKAKHLHDIRLREGKRYRMMKHEIKKWEHKKLMLERSQKTWTKKFEQKFKEIERKSAQRKAQTRKKVEQYKRRIREIHERDRERRRHLLGMEQHLSAEKRLVARLRAILAHEEEKNARQLMALKRQNKRAQELRRLEAKRLKELHAHQELKKRQEAEILTKRRKLHYLEGRWSHEKKRYSKVKRELEKTKQKWKSRYLALLQEAKSTRLANAHELVLEKARTAETKRRSALVLQQLRKKRAGYLKTLMILKGKLMVEKMKRIRAIREQKFWKREKAKLERQKANYIRTERRERANYLREVVRGQHLRKRQQEMNLKLKEMIMRQHKREASFKHMRIQEVHWKNKIRRGRRIYKRLHEEVAAIRRRFVHEKRSVRKAALVLQRLKLHIRKVIHRNHVMELHVKTLENVLHRRRLILKHRGAKLNAEWKQQDRAFKSEAHQRSILEKEL